MGNSDEGKPSKSDKSTSPAPQDQTNIHVYPDWPVMQAYYGPRVALPPYYNSAVASGHAPHPYMWGPPQPMIPPYGAPYAIYSHGGVYAHPAVPMGSHPQGPGVPPSPVAATPLGAETPTKSSGNTDRGLMKNLKGFDGLAMSIGNGNAESAEGGERRPSQSEETEGSSDGSDGNTTRARKRSREGTPTIGKALGPVVSPAMTSTLEIKDSPGVNAAMASPTGIPQTPVLPSEGWSQNERELKRERRKQSNRESARRSRLRKQAETEELARKVDSLMAENVTLKSEINQLTERSEKLRLENAVLAGKLKNTQLGHTKGIFLKESDEPRAAAASTENLLARVNNSASSDRKAREDDELYERNSKSGAKLHQLLDTSPRTDAVPAG